MLIAGAAVAVLGKVAALQLLASPNAGRSSEIARHPLDEVPPTPRVEELVPREGAADRIAAAETPPAIEAAPAEAGRTDHPDPPMRIRGRVLDVRGKPIPAVAVGAEGVSEPLARSDAFGVFAFDLEGNGRKLVSKSDGWITVRYDLVERGRSEREHLVLVAEPIALTGRVVDESNRPIAGARVAVWMPISTFAGFPYALDATGVVAPSVLTKEDGSFRIERAPAVERARLQTSADGFEVDTRPIPADPAPDFLVEMRKVESKGAVLEGVVFHEDGSPADGAIVHLLDREATTDARGNFRLEIGRVPPDAPLVATKPGFQPAVLPEYGRLIDATDGHPPAARLMLGPEPLTIAGRVLEADGRPCEGWSVSIAEGTAITQFQIPVVTAESRTAGKKNRGTTDAKGAFEIGGLRDMPYVLQAWGRDGRMIRSAHVSAGTRDLELRCDPDAFLPRIAGRVVTREGAPLPGLRVEVALVTVETEFGSAWDGVQETTTNSDGTFEFERVPKRSTRLTVQGDEVTTTSLRIEEIDLDRPLEIVVVRLLRFRFVGEPGPNAPTFVGVLDREGQSLELVTRQARSTMSGRRARLADGSSHVLSTSEDAARLVLYRGEEILSSQPLRLVPGEIVTLRRER
jgi:protocatechuate 3,4-dioxygenase beta subunit